MMQPRLLPVYLVIDVSALMAGPKLDSANRVLPVVVDSMARNPILSDKVRFGVVDFSDDARVQLPLCDVLDPRLTLPTLTSRAGRSYAAAFSALREQIARDVDRRRDDGFVSYRPVVFFLSYGVPTDCPTDWRRAFQKLVGMRSYPNLIPFGVDRADPAIMASLVHPAEGPKRMRMYVADHGQDVAEIFRERAEVLISSIVPQGDAMVRGPSGLVLPTPGARSAGDIVLTDDKELDLL